MMIDGISNIERELAQALQMVAQGASTLTTMENLVTSVCRCFVEMHDPELPLYAKNQAVAELYFDVMGDRWTKVEFDIASIRGDGVQ